MTGFDSLNDNSLFCPVLQELRGSSSEGIIIAVTSTKSGEGVTHSVTALLNNLSQDCSKRVLRINAENLNKTTCAPATLFRFFTPMSDNIFNYSITAKTSTGQAELKNSWAGSWQYRRDCIKHLRASFDYIVVDCPALKSTGDVFYLAPLVDGIIIVIEAGVTRVDNILNAEKSIKFAQGKIVGHILNKRRCNMPYWIRKLL